MMDFVVFFNFAAELSPFAAHIYFNRGNLNASSGRFKNAEEDYTKGKKNLRRCIYQFIRETQKRLDKIRYDWNSTLCTRAL